MVRLADLLGNQDKPEERPAVPSKPRAPAPAATPPPVARVPVYPVKPAATASAAPQVASTKLGKSATSLAPMVEALYAQLIFCVRDLFDNARAGKPLDLSEADRLTQQLPRLAAGQYDDILILDDARPNDHYLVSHCVHVAFLSHHLALCLGYTEATAHQLALAGLLIDIGMAGKIEELALQPRQLTKEEKRDIEQHSVNAMAMLQKSQQLSQEALNAIGSHHSRPDGKGYPKEAPSAISLEYSKILAVADVYDALTHPRSYRKPLNPAQAMKQLINGVGDQFDRRMVKALVDELSLYPRGSMVRLNTNELAVIQRINPAMSLRPIVLIHRDSDRNAVVPPRLVNLMDHPLVSIKEVVLDPEAS